MAKTSAAQLAAVDRYNKEHTKSVTIRFMPSEMDVYESLMQQPNKSGYIKSLIAADMGLTQPAE